jgi:hypothetical protein
MFPAVSLLSQLIVPGPARSLAVSIFAAPKLAKELPARVLLWTYFRYHREVGMNREPKAQASRVNITKYVKVATGRRGMALLPVVRSSNARIRADYVLVDGKTEFHKEGAYYIEWYAAGKRRRESVVTSRERNANPNPNAASCFDPPKTLAPSPPGLDQYDPKQMHPTKYRRR